MELVELAKQFCGAESAEDAVLLEQFCAAEAERWRNRLRDGVTEADCGAAFSCAVALCAAADCLTARNGTEAAPSFTAGAVSVQGRSAAETEQAVHALRQLAEQLMCRYAALSDFSVRSVRG